MLEGKEVFPRILCPTCAAEKERTIEHQRTWERLNSMTQDWNEFCPPAFSEIDLQKLPNQDLLRAILAWNYGERGLLIAGQPGTGKTRCAWQLMKREYFSNRKCFAFTAYDISTWPMKLMSETLEAERWLQTAMRAELLLMDDPFKAKLTERAEEVLFMIVDERTANQRPIIVTTNDTDETLVTRLSADRGMPMIRRLREFSDILSV